MFMLKSLSKTLFNRVYIATGKILLETAQVVVKC